MSWFKRLKEGISTATKNKRETPDGIWYRCKQCKHTTTTKEVQKNFYKCVNCDYHIRIGSEEYFDIIFDDQTYEVLFAELKSKDTLKFVDLKPYPDRLKDAYATTKLNDAMNVAVGHVQGYPLVVACMEFKFIGGSMGSVVGEKISRAIDLALENEAGLLIISKSGGARMMEAAFSLMQMAKTAAKLTLLAKARLPYFSLCTDPTTGGVTASYAMLGDINMSEPGALIGFAGPRVIKETIKRDLPPGFQTAEFLFEKGFLDFIVNRSELRQKLATLLELYLRNRVKS
ncbi:MAG: acetyl-CoA carboxylase, carboxyltransferase subunit beta [Saprospiraceae bacterium]